MTEQLTLSYFEKKMCGDIISFGYLNGVIVCDVALSEKIKKMKEKSE